MSELERALRDPDAALVIGEALAYLPVPAELITPSLGAAELARGLRNEALSPEARARVQALVPPEVVRPPHVRRPPRPPVVSPPLPRTPPPSSRYAVSDALTAVERAALVGLPLAARVEKLSAAVRERRGASRDDAMIAVCLELLKDPDVRLAELHALLAAFAWPAREAWRALARDPRVSSALAEQLLAGERTIKTQGERERFLAACEGLVENTRVSTTLRGEALRKLDPQRGAHLFDPEVDDPELLDLLSRGPDVQQQAAARAARLSDAAAARLLVGRAGEVVVRSAALTLEQLERLVSGGLALSPRLVDVVLDERGPLSTSLLLVLAARVPLASWRGRTGLPDEVYEQLLVAVPTRTYPLWEALAADDAVPEGVLRRLWTAPDLRVAIACRPRAAALLDEVAPTLDDPALDAYVVRHPGISAQTRACVVARLAGSAHAGARAMAAAQPWLEEPWLARLAGDTSRDVRLSLSAHAPGRVALRAAAARSERPLLRALASGAALGTRDVESTLGADADRGLSVAPVAPSSLKSRAGWRQRLDDHTHGLLRMHEGDSVFRAVVVEPGADGARVVGALRALGHVVEREAGAFERALSSHRASDSAAMLEILQRFSDPHDLLLAGEVAHDPVRERHELTSLWVRGGEPPVARVVRALDQWLALVPPHSSEQSNVSLEVAPAPDVVADGGLRAVLAELAARAPTLPTLDVPGHARRWGFGVGPSPDHALEQALLAQGVLRRDAVPFRGLGALGDPDAEATPETEYARLDALLLGLGRTARWVYGWTSPYDELILGVTAADETVGVATMVSWT
jgi:hypothetical protein